jgi:hypothetical protein
MSRRESSFQFYFFKKKKKKKLATSKLEKKPACDVAILPACATKVSARNREIVLAKLAKLEDAACLARLFCPAADISPVHQPLPKFSFAVTSGAVIIHETLTVPRCSASRPSFTSKNKQKPEKPAALP